MQPDSSVLGNLTTGILYKNPKPHVKSVHAYFPSVAAMPNGELLATYVLGEAFEADEPADARGAVRRRRPDLAG